MGYDEGYRGCKGWSQYELEQSHLGLAQTLKAHERACQNFHTQTHSPFRLQGRNVVCTKCEQVVAVMPKKGG